MLYKDAGVDIEKKESLLSYVKKLSGEVGRFGGRFPIGKKTLIASVDGVGTKLLIALSLKKHNTVGEDLVNHCVNDILCEGAKPLFFMDYISIGKLNETIFKGVISGIVSGCEKNGIVLLGGETAELPSFYTDNNSYDLVGFIVGIADKIITGDDIREGDVLIGLPSNGLHTNGYSLVRKIIEEKKLSLDEYIPGVGHTLGEELLRVHRSYLDLLSPFPPFSSSSLPIIKGIAHITGGSFYGNIPRIIPKGYGAVVKKNSWDVPYIFKFIKEVGKVPEDEMYRVFNMGIGMILVMDRNKVDIALNTLREGFIIGEITRKKGLVLAF